MSFFFHRLFYLVENLLARSTAYQLLLVVFAVVGISFLGGTAVYFFGTGFDHYPGALWWAFLRLTDPGYLGDDQGNVNRTISTVLTVAGYVVFLGALVAIMTNWLNRFMAYLSSGHSPIFEEDHLLVLGWNDRMPILVEEMIHSKDRIKRSHRLSRFPAIVILTAEYRASLLHELRMRIRNIGRYSRLLVRAGNPLEFESLKRVDFLRASCILLPAAHDAQEQRHLSDAQTLKILLSLATRARQADPDHLPLLVVEIVNPEYRELAEAAAWPGDLQIVTGAEMVGQLVTQNLRQPGFSGIYNTLLNDTLGESIYLCQAKWARVAGMTLREAVQASNNAVPIGRVLPRSDTEKDVSRLHLLSCDETFEPDDEVAFLARKYKSMRLKKGSATQSAAPDTEETTLCVPAVAASGTRRLLVLGWSQVLVRVIRELATFSEEKWQIDAVSRLSADELRGQVSEVLDTAPHLQLEILHGVIERPGEIAKIAPNEYDRVLILGSERVVNRHLSDARSIMVYAELERYWAQKQIDHPRVLIELNEEMNADIFEGKPNVEFILSQEITSHLLAQVAIRRSLAWICEELFTSKGAEICFVKPEKLGASIDQEYSFSALQQLALRHESILLGWQQTSGRSWISQGCVLAPGGSQTIRLQASDNLIVLTRDGDA